MAAIIPDVCAVVPAAGFGRRMQTECPKQYLSVGNKTILEHAVDALLANPRVARVIIPGLLLDFPFYQSNPFYPKIEKYRAIPPHSLNHSFE